MEAQYTSISVSFASKQEWTRSKEIGAKTYDKAVQYLIKSRKKGIPSTAGCDPDFRYLPGIPEAIRIAYLIDTWTWIDMERHQ